MDIHIEERGYEEFLRSEAGQKIVRFFNDIVADHDIDEAQLYASLANSFNAGCTFSKQRIERGAAKSEVARVAQHYANGDP